MDSDNGDSAMDVEVDVDEAGVCSGGPCSSGDTATTRHVLAHIAAAEVAGDNGHHVAMDPLESGDGQLTQRERDRRKSEKEKERTKMRERYRRAVTGRILAGLRKHGNYSLPMRADINDVLRALAREAGWTVDQDGTTYRSNPNTSNAPRSSSSTPISSRAGANAMVSTIQSPQSLAQQQQQQQQHVSVADTRMAASVPCHLMGHSFPIGMRNVTTPDVNWSTFCPDTKLKAPKSAVKDITKSCKLSRPYGRHASFNNLGLTRQIRGSVVGMDNPLEADVHGQVDHDFQEPERNFADTGYVPIYVMLPLGIVNHDNRVVEPERLIHDLRVLKSLNVDGVMVDVWWGLVEKDTPQRYDWTAYKYLFNIVRSAQLKLQVVMSFHQCGGNVGDDVNIPLPRWILDVGAENSDIYFTDKHGTRNTECLSWGVDKERVLRGRTGLEVFFDFMRSFRQKFDELFVDGTIAEIEVGLGACGELRYPSYPPRNGWTYPGIGEFQCYDRYLMKSLRKAAEARGHPEWGRGPDGTGDYNSRPQDTDFFRDGGDYDSYYGRFFLRWYSDTLIEHGDRVLALARLAFEDTKISAKISGIHWWYKMASHAAELTAGFYNPSNRDGYAPITQMLAKHNVTFNFTCVEHRHLAHEEEFPEAFADPEGLVWQVLNAAWDANLSVASENALPCFDRDGYNKILENVKPRNNPDKRHMASFTYLRLSSELMERDCLVEFTRFVKCLHGKHSLASDSDSIIFKSCLW